MPPFSYKAKDKQGQLISGTLDADTRVAATARLQAMGYFPVEIRGAEPVAAKGVTGKIQRAARGGSRIKSRNLTTFYRQMSDLVGAGVPLVKSLGVVKTQCADPALATLIGQIDRDVQGGDTFARALDRHPKVFNKLTTAMVMAGETGGLLEEVLSRLADFAEAEEEVKSKIRSALAYPLVMVIAGIGAIIVLMTFVIPKIVGVFRELNQTLPLITQILIAVSGFFSHYWYVLALAIVGVVLGIQRYRATAKGKVQLSWLALRVPILGEIVLKREVARFTRTLGSLLRNGVPILSALDVSAEVLGNEIIRREVKKVPEGIAEGKGVSGTLRGSTFFPPVVTNMIAIGEETGNMPGVLLKVASTYEAQVDRSVKTLTAIIEPIIILILGLVVGFIVISMLLPIFELDPTKG